MAADSSGECHKNVCMKSSCVYVLGVFVTFWLHVQNAAMTYEAQTVRMHCVYTLSWFCCCSVKVFCHLQCR